MNKIHLEFRAKTPEGGWFYQHNQHLTSFLRRVLVMYGVTHPTYLKTQFEDLLQININNEWVQCEFNPVDDEEN